ncbi:uncharacterized protein [Henckelia pumila]|uniref:uncharacterized protein n=1 Tax=Henckelia pumila TaxID=405737 RepID=UPI003C6DED72
MEEGANPTHQPQRKLNPPMMEVVKEEILKLLEVGEIYPIFDSKWVSPVQVVLMKTGITVVKNKDDELLPTRIQNAWRVCIDYKKLNAETRKDHFPLPFIDQMIERLAYCNCTGRSGKDDVHLTIWHLFLSAYSLWTFQRTSHISMVYGFYRIYIQDFAKIASPMCKLLQKDAAFEFDDTCKSSFDKLKESLTFAPIIQPPDWSKPFEIMCDASDYVVGAVLGQRVQKASYTIYYASRILNDA